MSQVAALPVPAPPPEQIGSKPDVLLIEGCNFLDYPPGGQLSSAKQFMSAFGNRLALVGSAPQDAPIGRWVEREFGGTRFAFFGVMRVDRTRTVKPPVPARLSFYFALRRHMREIRALGVRNVLVQSPEALLAAAAWDWEGLCYRAPGVANMLAHSRYAWSRPFRGVYERQFFRALRRADVVLASADAASIEQMVRRSGGLLDRAKVFPFPTRVDTSIFFPRPRDPARAALGLAAEGPVLVSCGRLNRVKGWDLLLEAFALLRPRMPSAALLFVGDGEDRAALESQARRLGLGNSVVVTGFKPQPRIAEYLAAADLFVMGSHSEGWSVAMLEALACGKRIVSTDVSGASEMIDTGRNGFIVPDRQPASFADATEHALRLDPGLAAARSLELSGRYALKNLPAALAERWPVLALPATAPGRILA